MSTTFFKACKNCLAHPHKISDEPVAHRWYGGKGLGTQIRFYAPLTDATILLDEGGDMILVSDLKAQEGGGK